MCVICLPLSRMPSLSKGMFLLGMWAGSKISPKCKLLLLLLLYFIIAAFLYISLISFLCTGPGSSRPSALQAPPSPIPQCQAGMYLQLGIWLRWYACGPGFSVTQECLRWLGCNYLTLLSILFYLVWSQCIFTRLVQLGRSSFIWCWCHGYV